MKAPPSAPGNLDRRRMRRLYEAMSAASRPARFPLAGIEVPALLDLRPGDIVVTTQLTPAVQRLAGAAPAPGRSRRLALASPRGSDLASLLAFASGAAFTSRLQRRRTLVVALVRQAAPREVWRDALLLAAGRSLPVLFVLEAEDADLDPLLAHAQDANVAAMVVDGGDPVAVYRVFQEAQPRARGGDGPAFIACVLGPMPPDPLSFLRGYLERHGYPVRQWRSELAARRHRPHAAGQNRTAPAAQPRSAAPHVVVVR